MLDHTPFAQPHVTKLKDYQRPTYTIQSIHLTLELEEHNTRVCSKLKIIRQTTTPTPLILDYDRNMRVDLETFQLNNQPIAKENINLHASTGKIEITLPHGETEFTLNTTVYIAPGNNKSYEGLYTSAGSFFTQCEAEGFRRITPFIDRPDVLATYTTILIAPRNTFPVLLGNGNLIHSGPHPQDPSKHIAEYFDPFPKPSYLFAMVAGDLQYIEDTFVTQSGRNVTLRIYVHPKDLGRCDHAMQSLKKSMRWDEEKYGREYDLDIFNIVAVDDFNAGAMENKSLNIFNSKYVLASPESATDTEFQNIESVVAHEYFHNWTGNRVTCRDWFQLTLKEGLTVFRDQEFSADMGSRHVCRITDVQRLRNVQFPEDASPLAHPARPSTYMEISNFYTATVYEKGAEIIRMLHSLVGKEGFRRGTDLYFERHDGQAVTCEDWLAAMSTANPHIDLKQFKRWYTQSGTPRVQVQATFDSSAQTLSLSFKQQGSSSPNVHEFEPLHIPIAVGIVQQDGTPASFLTPDGQRSTQCVLDLRDKTQTFVLQEVLPGSVPSLLRGFSAPIYLDFTNQETTDLIHLFHYDEDVFNKWESSQKLMEQLMCSSLDANIQNEIFCAYQKMLHNTSIDNMMKATFLSFPSVATLIEKTPQANPVEIYHKREKTLQELAKALNSTLKQAMEDTQKTTQTLDAEAIGGRALYNACLRLRQTLNEPELLDTCIHRVQTSPMMTDALAALEVLAKSNHPDACATLEDFYQRWSDNFLVTTNWLGVQARAAHPDGLQRVEKLMQHPAFQAHNPNCLYAVLGGFMGGNILGFHHHEGKSYPFMAGMILKLDTTNPHVSSQLCKAFSNWKKLHPTVGTQIQTQLQHIQSQPNLSTDLAEIVSKSLM
ncbi:MAG: aminopeptidase N [Zetaproteobacteria bacterium]|nr:aminopeptidase N [Zetaproteobacteria bacterium]